jgi:hypothetical protein
MPNAVATVFQSDGNLHQQDIQVGDLTATFWSLNPLTNLRHATKCFAIKFMLVAQTALQFAASAQQS